MAQGAGRRAWGTLLLLTLVASVSLLDRQIITILAVDIKRDLGLNDSEIGLVYGTFFAVFYALFSIPLGRLADGWIRTRQIAISLVGWSAATVGCAFATGFGSLASARIGVAIGEAGAGPSAYSLIADIFPKRQRATAFAIYGASAGIGIGLSMALGGLVVDAWNSSFPGGRGWLGLAGWQAAFIVAALPGFVLAALMLFCREPQRGESEGLVQPNDPQPFRRAGDELLALVPPLSLWSLRRLKAGRGAYLWNIAALACAIGLIAGATFAVHGIVPPGALSVYGTFAGLPLTSHLIQWAVLGFGCYVAFSWVQSQRLRDMPAFAIMWSSRAYIAILVVAAFNLMVNYAYVAWAAPFAVQQYGTPLSEVGIKLGIAAVIAGGGGTILGGWLADKARARLMTGRLWVLLFTTAVPVPMAFITLSQPDFDGFLLWFVASSIILTGFLPCCTATLHDLVLPRMRGSAVAIMYLGITIIGMGTGPYMVGLISDITGDLGTGIRSIFVSSAITWAAIFVAIRALAKDETTLIARARAAGENI